MPLVPVVALWALCPLLARADRPPVTVTVTAAIGEDACLPCGSEPWGALRGVTLSCSHQAGGHQVPVLRHRLGGHSPPAEPGWQPPLQPDSRFRDRVAFCAAGTGDAGVAVLLRNLSDPDFGNYSCYAARAAAPQLLCSLVLQPAVAEVPKAAEPDMIMVICVLTAAFTAVAIGVVICNRCGGRCWGRRAGGKGRGRGLARRRSLRGEAGTGPVRPRSAPLGPARPRSAPLGPARLGHGEAGGGPRRARRGRFLLREPGGEVRALLLQPPLLDDLHGDGGRGGLRAAAEARGGGDGVPGGGPRHPPHHGGHPHLPHHLLRLRRLLAGEHLPAADVLHLPDHRVPPAAGGRRAGLRLL